MKKNKKRENHFNLHVCLGRTLRVILASKGRRSLLAIELDGRKDAQLKDLWSAYREDYRNPRLRSFDGRLFALIDVDAMEEFLEEGLQSTRVGKLKLTDTEGRVEVSIDAVKGLDPVTRTFPRKFLEKAMGKLDLACSLARAAHILFVEEDDERASVVADLIETGVEREFAKPTTKKEVDSYFAAAGTKVPEPEARRPKKATAGGAKLGDLAAFKAAKVEATKPSAEAEERHAKAKKARADEAAREAEADKAEAPTLNPSQIRMFAATLIKGGDASNLSAANRGAVIAKAREMGWTPPATEEDSAEETPTEVAADA